MRSVRLMLKRAFWAIFLCLVLISFPLPSFAITVQDVPNPQQVYRGWVTDMANLLDSETKAKLNQMISELEAENGTEIAVVTVPDTSPAPIPKYRSPEKGYGNQQAIAKWSGWSSHCAITFATDLVLQLNG